jgi:hypothetical protein
MGKAICICLLVFFFVGCPGIDSPRFPWPPPQPSAFTRIPGIFLKKSTGKTSVGDVAKILENALNNAGYKENVWFYVRDGFVLMTQLEQIDPETGSPLEDVRRWGTDIAPPKDLESYLNIILKPKEAHFRLIAFVFTTQKCTMNVFPEIKHIDFKKWLSPGIINGLPGKVKNLPYVKLHNCAALIYEFKKFAGQNELVFKNRSKFPGIKHLEITKIWEKLKDGEKEKNEPAK